MSPRRFMAAAGQQLSTYVDRVVSALQHQRRFQLVVVAVVAMVCAVLLSDAVMAVRREKEMWSSDSSVVILTRDVNKGDLISSINTRVEQLPRALTASDAITTTTTGLTARVSMRANTPLSQSLVVLPSDAIRLPVGWRVIALSPDLALPEVSPGDHVDVVVGDTVVANRAVVVSLTPLSVALPSDVVARVAAAARLGEVTVVALA